MDNREKYAHLLWERFTLIQSNLSNNRSERYAEAPCRVCHAYIENLGYQLVYCFGSGAECKAAVVEHNKHYQMRNLLLGVN